MSLPRINLYAQILLVLALMVGMFLARERKFALHGAVQSAVVVANLGLIAWIMGPSFHRQLLPGFWGNFKDSHYAIAAAHVVVGAVAWIVAAYVVLVAGTPLVPKALRFENYKLWMRIAMALWWAAFLLGVGIYFVWYVKAG
jgi:uncharacterized membrane protein YozB (DUF420 family)